MNHGQVAVHMKILVCVSGNAPGYTFERTQVFVYEQIESVKKLDASVDYQVFPVVGKGIKGYLASLKQLKKAIKEYQPDIVHAHCGHVGAMAVLQRDVPVITTFHGTDVNSSKMRPLASFASLLSAESFFVSKMLMQKLPIKGKHKSIIRCGVDRSIFHPRDKEECKKQLGIEKDYILFASDFGNGIKNPALAKAVATHFPDLELREIKNRSREEVAQLINGAELLLMTSFSEGSPQIIKETIACGQRLVSVDVGDVRDQTEGLNNCRVCEADEKLLVAAVREVLNEPLASGEASGKYDMESIAKTVLDKYHTIIQNYGKH